MRVQSIEQLDFEPVREVFPSPLDWRDEVIYQLLIDRFDDGVADEALPLEERQSQSTDAEELTGFLGGQIRGITRRLDYIRDLGCTTIWISPPFKNCREETSSHGYRIQNFLMVDPRWGTHEDFQELVRAAHLKNMRVVVDVVLNHTGKVWHYAGEGHPPYRSRGAYDLDHWQTTGIHSHFGADDAVWPVELQDANCFHRQGVIRDFESAGPREMLNGDFPETRDLDLENRQVLNALIVCYKWWIAQTDCDGFRLDAVKHMAPEPVAIFCNAIREYALSIGKTNFLFFGEVIGDDELLKKYVASNEPQDQQRYPLLDACLDFPLHGVLEDVIKGNESPAKIRRRYEKMQHYYRDYGRCSRYFVTFLDNHDQIFHPHRRFMHDECDDRLAIAGVAFLLTSMGIPCLYYGTEQGFGGGGESDVCVREPMFKSLAQSSESGHFFRTDHPVYRALSSIAKIRLRESALRYGRQYFCDVAEHGKQFAPSDTARTLAFERILDRVAIVVAINLADEPVCDRVAVAEEFHTPGKVLVDLLSGCERPLEATEDGIVYVQVPLEAHGVAILKNAASG